MNPSPSKQDALLAARSLRIYSRVEGRTRLIVDGIDLDLRPGETIGIVGESGSGKSLTARALLSLLPTGVYADGEITFKGQNLLELPERKVARLRGNEIALIFQDPFTMLNPLRSCGDHIVETLRDGRGRSLKRSARREEASRRLAEVGIHDPAVCDRYPFQLSGGMRQRVGIAAALSRDPSLVIADEPSTALDVTTQKQILSLLNSLQKSREMGLIMITHDLRVAFSMCDRVYVLYAGAVLENGPAGAIEEEPLHPYTLGLLLSEPPVDRRLRELTAIPGSVPPAGEVSRVCQFSSRCSWVKDECRHGRPDLRLIGPDRASACVRLPEIRDEMRTLRGAVEVAASKIHATPPTGNSLVRVRNLSKIFKVRSAIGAHSVNALIGASIEVRPGESVGLVGESGSGKTTLARCLVGLETPSSGEIEIAGVPAANYSNLTLQDRRTLRRTVQIVFQDPYSSLNPVLTVGATLSEALSVAGKTAGAIDATVSELLNRVGLPAEYARRKPVALSGGERQRVAIARALAVRPQLLVCDEPVSALDVSVQAQILNLFKQLRATYGMAYLFITHDLAVVRQIVERVYVMHRGVIVEEGAVDDVLENPKHPYTATLIDSLPRPEADWLERTPAVAAHSRNQVR